MKILQTDERFIDAMKLLGENSNLSLAVVEILEEYTCRLYGDKKNSKINECRFNMFVKKNIPTPERLPPTQDALLLHCKRVNYQVYLWKQALQNNIDIKDPRGISSYFFLSFFFFFVEKYVI